MHLSMRVSAIFILAFTLFRIVMLRVDVTDLFVDEAQYWQWSQHLDFGYYSKPPMIAWVIHLFTSLGHSNDIFWVRVASPVFHMATGFILMAAAARLTGSREIGAWAGLTYVTLPGVALSSVFMSTDTILFPFYASALYAYARLCEKQSLPFAILLGLAIGAGTLSKYAMLYFVATAALAAIFMPKARLGRRDIAIAALMALLIILPNIIWNATHGAATLKHTSDNAGWNGLHFHLGNALEFLAAQFGVIGPVLFAALLLVLRPLFRHGALPVQKQLAFLSWPIIIVIIVQALMSRAYANWAATAYIAGTILAVSFLLLHSPRWLKISLGINVFASLAFPLLTVYAHDVRLPNGNAVLDRYLGRSALSWNIAATATRAGTTIIVADDRDVLADLFYTLRDEHLTLLARADGGRPKNYYEQEFPLTAARAEETVLYVTDRSMVCHGVAIDPFANVTPREGYFSRAKLKAYAIPASCLTNQIG